MNREIIIQMSESDKQGLLDWASRMDPRAREWERQCLKILESQGADLDSIEPDLFFHLAIGQLMQGKGLVDPVEYVERAKMMYWPWVLGLPARTSTR